MAQQMKRPEDLRQDLPTTSDERAVTPAPESEKSLGKSMLMKVALASLLVAQASIRRSSLWLW